MSIRFIIFTALIILLACFIYPLEAKAHGKHKASGSKDRAQSLNTPYIIKEGKLPGVTWVDDVHPIFARNRCGECHTRTREASVEQLSEFALGLINPDDPSDPYYSYHELVYAEGPPQIQEGETLRDGQCCWPRKYSPEQQRRIWIRHDERSVIMRKLEGDYFDLNNPPRFIEEGLKLLWGIPMPMFHIKEEEPGHAYNVRSFFGEILFNISLWFGKNRDKLYK